MTVNQRDRAKAKSVKPIAGLAPYLAPYRMTIIGVCVALLLAAALTLSLPLAMRRVIDGFTENDYALIDKYFLALVAVAIGLAFATAARYYLVTRLGERVVADVRSGVFSHVSGMSPGFFERVMTAEVVNRLTTDTTVILTVVGSTMSIALRNIVMLCGGIIMLLITSPKLTLLTLLIVPATLVPVLVMGRYVRRLSRQNQDLIADTASSAGEMLQAAQTIQAMTHVERSRAQFTNSVEMAYDAALKRVTMRAVLTMVAIGLAFSGVIGIVWLGARDVMAGTMSAGEMAQFVIYAVLTAGSVGALSEVWGEMQRAAGATERLVELLEMENPVEDPSDPVAPDKDGRGAVSFTNVRFSYPTRPDVSALNDVSFAVAPGETVALVGPSGAGKTTVLQLLLRFYDPESGEIAIDGVPLTAMKKDAFRSRIALVPQDPVIFATTVRENLLLGRPDASEDEMIAAAKAAAAHEFVEALPDGYDTWLGERGILLSGGQKQRLAIGRAILRDAPLLLLDEATSALDAESERAVQQAVERLSRERTTIVIAHRLATVKRADKIIVFDAGKIVATGTHDDLVAQGGLYARLARLQFTASYDDEDEFAAG